MDELERLQRRVSVLEAAGNAVVANWDNGDLAQAVRILAGVLAMPEVDELRALAWRE